MEQNEVIGRQAEKVLFNDIFSSNQSEFVAIYGRRRVGKTYLVRETFSKKFSFEISGLANADTKEQLVNFSLTLKKTTGEELKTPKSWLEAFSQLSDYLEKSKQKRKILFFDEMPWMDTPRSGFLTALEHFWNGWASARKDIVLIVCGSATSWIINNLINNHGGLHNRLTHTINLKPFTLSECDEYFKWRKIDFSRYQIAEIYMAMGGIPFYLSKIERGLSVAQNIDNLFFAKNPKLKNEFKNLYAALFRNSNDYVKIVEALSKKGKGLTREEISRLTKISNGGGLTKVLQNLEYCDFIRTYNSLGKKTRNTLYQLIDPYTLFYFRFIQKNEFNDEHFWANSIDTPLHNTWAGFAFEMLALQHTAEIKKALGISGIQSAVSAWRSKISEKAAQIDLVIRRKDGIINIVEIKYCNEKFTITKNYEENLRNKISAFKAEIPARNAVHLVLLTTFGLNRNKYSGIAQKELTLNCLFD
ncbi:MAG: AAA family ATPase [Bacteroidetes bacterium]|nr:AAA family ATPase [Bacteroidota bacterium]